MLKWNGEHLSQEILSEPGELPDSALMERFVSASDSDAFEKLVLRHGPMVLGVCRRVLRNGHDADDAFQTAFLVFFRKAHSIRRTEKVANWLYGVAYRSALRAKSARHHMQTRETHIEKMAEPQTSTANDQWQELEGLLDDELSKIPERYRLPLVLCELEGVTIKEAAGLLNCPEGTVSGNLSRGRTMLRNRLARHGLMLSIAALATGLSQHAAAATLPTPLLTSTIHGARLLASGQAGLVEAYSAKVAALTKGVMKSMLLSKLKFTGAALMAAGILGAGVITATLSSNRSVAQDRTLVADASQQQAGNAKEVAERNAAIARNQAAVAQGNVGGENPEFMAEVEELMKRGNLTLEQAKHEIAEKYANIEKTANAPQEDLTLEQVQKQIEADRAKAAAEKAASGHDPGSGDNQPADQAAKITAEKAALEKAAAEQQATLQNAR